MTEGKFIPGNQSANTPDLYESELRRMQMSELIDLAQQVGLTDIDQMRRDDLITAISARYRETQAQQADAQGGGAQQQAAGQSAGGDQGQSQAQSQGQSQGQGDRGGQAVEGKFIPGNQSANTPDFYESELRRLQMPQLIEVARQVGLEGADGMRRDDLIREISIRQRQLQT